MEDKLFTTEAINIWKPAVAPHREGDLVPEPELSSKLMQIIQVGDFFYWIFNLMTSSLDKVSTNIYPILGYEPAEFNFELLMSCIHPDDRPYFLNFEIRIRDFLANLPVNKLMKYKVRYDFRFKRKQGDYIRLLHQAIVIQHDETGKVMRTLGVETDITHLKPMGRPVLSFIGIEGEPSYVNIETETVFEAGTQFLSKREREILMLLIDGMLSKQIADILSISKQTVDAHRKNMLNKNGFKNTAELIAFAIKNGWV